MALDFLHISYLNTQSDSLVLHRKTLPVHTCVGETGSWCERWEKINKSGQKPLVIMTHGDDF